MDNKTFMEETEYFWQVCRMTLKGKNLDYARGGDKLHNFKRAARFRGIEPEMALEGMVTKQITALYDLLDDLVSGEVAPIGVWEEKIMDIVNYMFLLRALLVDRNQSTFSGCAATSKAPVEEKNPSPAESVGASGDGASVQRCPTCGVLEGHLHENDCLDRIEVSRQHPSGGLVEDYEYNMVDIITPPTFDDPSR